MLESPLASVEICEFVEEDEADEAPPCGCFSSFCTSRCSLDVSDVWVEVLGEAEEGEEAEGLGKGGKGKGS